MTFLPTGNYENSNPIIVGQTATATPSPVFQPTTGYDPENYSSGFERSVFSAPEVEQVVEENKTQKSLFVWGVIASIAIKVFL